MRPDGHGTPDQVSLPMARSVSPGSSSLTRRSLQVLTAGIACRSTSLRADVLDMRRWSATCGTFMRPSGRLFASNDGTAADPRISAPAFSQPLEPLSDIPAFHGNASHCIWRMSSFMGWPTVLSSRIWCHWVAARPKESRLFDGTSREIPDGRRMRKAAQGGRPR